MKLLVLGVLAFAAIAQAERDWAKIKPAYLYRTPDRPAPAGPKIVNGKEAERHQFPHQVALIMSSGSFCGGAIIRADVILTAAHCAEGASFIDVIAGAHNIQEEESTQQSIRSSKIIIHEGWDRGQLINDIALVILSENIKLGDTAKVISVSKNSCPDSSYNGATATISGWGRPSDSSGSISPVLRFATNEILTNAVCRYYFSNIINTHICFDGDGGRGGCNGDSGGPMIVHTDDGVEEVGIASFVSGAGCEATYPTVYTRVSCFHDWIQSKIN